MSEPKSIGASAEKPQVEYRPIPGFPGYRVGDDGSVWSCLFGGRYARQGSMWKRRKDKDNGTGYRAVSLRVGGRSVCRYVQRLVLEAFIGPCPPGHEACHGPDFTRSNNRLSNLRLGTTEENDKEARQPCGEKCQAAKLTEQAAIEALRLYHSGWQYVDIAKRFRMDERSVRQLVSGETWKHLDRSEFPPVGKPRTIRRSHPVIIETAARSLRKSLGLSFPDVREGTGLSLAAIHAIEVGHSRPTLPTAIKLASFYGKSVGELFPEHNYAT